MSKTSKVQNPEHIERICQLHAEGHTAPNIALIIQEETSAYSDLNNRNILTIVKAKVNATKIEKYRQIWLANPMDVDIANKRVRLEDLDNIRKKILNTLNKMTGKSDIIPSKDLKTYLTASKRLIEVEVAGREEIERKPDLVEAFGRIGPLADKTDEELITYDRELTIKLRAVKTAKSRIQDTTFSEVGCGEGDQKEGKQ